MASYANWMIVQINRNLVLASTHTHTHTHSTSLLFFSIRFGCLKATRAHALFITDLKSTRWDNACGKRSDFSMLMYFPVCHLCLPVFAFYSDLQTTLLSLLAVCLLDFYPPFIVTQSVTQGLLMVLSKLKKKARCQLKYKSQCNLTVFHY